MRAVLTSHPGYGHVHPMIALGRGLESRGHQVIVACADKMCPHIEAFGLSAAAAGLSWLESEVEQTFPDVLTGALQGNDFAFYEVFFGRAASAMIPDLEELCREWKPDLIIRNDFEFASTIVAERLGLPLAALGLEFHAPRVAWQALFGPQLAYLRSRHGLSPTLTLERIYGHLLLSCMPPSYSLVKPFGQPATHFIQLPTVDDPQQRPLPSWIDGLPPRPTVFASLGTTFNRTPEIMRTVIEGLAGERCNVIAVTGKNQDPSVFEPLPANVFMERYIPQTRLFPRCDLVICHGGFSTLMFALAHGLLPLVIPLSGHDPIHAARCEALGVGRALLYAPRLADYFDHEVPTLSPENVASTVRELLERSTYRRSLSRLRQEILALPDLDGTVDILESFAELRDPATPSGTRS